MFGAPFPDEFFVFTDVTPDDLGDGEATELPWNLAVPLEALQRRVDGHAGSVGP